MAGRGEPEQNPQPEADTAVLGALQLGMVWSSVWEQRVPGPGSRAASQSSSGVRQGVRQGEDAGENLEVHMGLRKPGQGTQGPQREDRTSLGLQKGQEQMSSL